ncbi:hypothetical protein HPB48_014495 [Haemaphysalis longicornis]|uniref:Uncharacterized protein n=1 Tax=Haemaphysalis longicornis TaxID=44386 RepID=A0A9J6GML4_HAELO|nr:hypothetical protein HPB48_014495 [Haemaphysalis longicornis]
MNHFQLAQLSTLLLFTKLFDCDQKQIAALSQEEPVLPSKDRKIFSITWDGDHWLYIYTNSTIPSLNKTLATKRIVLQAIAPTFDPLGAICPFVIKGKLLFQRL